MWHFLIFVAYGAQVNPNNCYEQCNHNGECREIYQEKPVENETLSSNFYCKCYEDFTGISCGECEYGKYGSSCIQCPTKNNKICSGNGICEMGIKSSGKCKCFDGFSQSTDCFEENNFMDA